MGLKGRPGTVGTPGSLASQAVGTTCYMGEILVSLTEGQLSLRKGQLLVKPHYFPFVGERRGKQLRSILALYTSGSLCPLGPGRRPPSVGGEACTDSQEL